MGSGIPEPPEPAYIPQAAHIIPSGGNITRVYTGNSMADSTGGAGRSRSSSSSMITFSPPSAPSPDMERPGLGRRYGLGDGVGNGGEEQGGRGQSTSSGSFLVLQK